MDQTFRKEILNNILGDFEKSTERVMFDSVEQSVEAVFGGMGGFDGEILTEIVFMPQYNDREEEVLQIFSTLTNHIEEELFDGIESRLNELNQKCMFGNFLLYRHLGQVACRYTIPLKVDDTAYSMQLFRIVWQELYGTMDFFFAYIMLISTQEDFMSLDEYMKSFEEQ